MPVLAKAATLMTAIAVAVSMWLGVSPAARDHHEPAVAASVAHDRQVGLSATSDAEARQMRHVTLLLARQAAQGARCDPAAPSARFATCVVPALRHLGIGGRTAANILNPVIAGVPFGRCKGYLLGLQAAADSAGDQARWLLPQLYTGDRRPAQHEVAGQIALAAKMLHRVVRAAPPGVCAPAVDGPAV